MEPNIELEPDIELETLFNISVKTLNFEEGVFLFAFDTLEELEKSINDIINNTYIKLIFI